MSPRCTLTATLLLLLTMDTMHARPAPPQNAALGAANATDDSSVPRLRMRVDERIAVGANEHFGGAAPRPLLQRLRQMDNAAAPPDTSGGAADDDPDDSTVRSERSTNLSHITGTSRKIQIYIKNRHLQIMPDGTVNGTNDDTSDYTIFQRTSVNLGELKIQSVATCLYLCMDKCGLLYGAPQFSEECIFRENIGLDHYNTYTSVRYSNSKKTMYMGLDGRGLPRRVQVPTLRHKRQFQLPPMEAAPGGKLGRLATYARVLPRHVAPSRVDELAHRLLLQRQRLQLEAAGAASGDEEGVALRHHGIAHLCPAPPTAGLVTPTPPRRPRKCTGRIGGGAAAPKKQQPKRKKKCSEEEDIEKCKRERKLRQQRLKKKKQQQTGPKRGRVVPTTTTAPPPSPQRKKGNAPKKPAAQKKNAPKRAGAAGGKKRTTTPTPGTTSPVVVTPALTPTPTSLVSTGGSD